ncbi:unnamed protein product [Ostreobium quekettii]|uniref:Uncharacterized protein n=1 Tax=Ostreobium quekettii TaxID=121088 RepID=A0A8S1J6R5_9CHLO|nr:unnamed protein product [Ostreobium quekettii]
MDGLSINDLEDGVLVKIFAMAVGAPSREFDPYFGGFFKGNQSLEPTVVEGFGMILTLPQVCKRWQGLIDSAPTLWSRVFVGKPDEGGPPPGPGAAMTYPPVVNLRWWSNHCSLVESLHIRGNQTKRDGPLDTFNLGVLSLLSSQRLRVLHLDDCFQNGASESLIPVLTGLQNLEQLQIGPARNEFARGVEQLTKLTNLRLLELQGMDDAAVQLSSKYLPISLEVLALGAVDICPNTEDNCHLTNLKVLKLVEVDWDGPFCAHIGNLINLEELVLSDVYHTMEHVRETELFIEELSKISALEKLRHLEVMGDLDNEDRGLFERIGEAIVQKPPFKYLEKLCISFQSMQEFSPAFGHFEDLTHLNLEGFHLSSVPVAIMELPCLVDLGLCSCGLQTFPTTAPASAATITLLRLVDNRFPEVPIGLKHWKGLQELDMSNNYFHFTDHAAFLLSLPDLECLRLFSGKARAGAESFERVENVDRGQLGCRLGYHLGYLCGGLQAKGCRVYL